jgi:hypothetical protein
MTLVLTKPPDAVSCWIVTSERSLLRPKRRLMRRSIAAVLNVLVGAAGCGGDDQEREAIVYEVHDSSEHRLRSECRPPERLLEHVVGTIAAKPIDSPQASDTRVLRIIDVDIVGVDSGKRIRLEGGQCSPAERESFIALEGPESQHPGRQTAILNLYTGGGCPALIGSDDGAADDWPPSFEGLRVEEMLDSHCGRAEVILILYATPRA